MDESRHIFSKYRVFSAAFFGTIINESGALKFTVEADNSQPIFGVNCAELLKAFI
jgi:hypothetical protein